MYEYFGFIESVRNAFDTLACLLFLAAYVPYILAMIRRKAEPSIASWLIWAVLDMITLFAMQAKDALNSQIVAATFGSTLVAILAFKYGKRGWNNIDKLCLGAAALAILLWKIFDQPLLGIAISLAVAILGAIPTWFSAYKDPSKENRTAWTLYFASCVFAILAIPRETFVDAAQPMTFFFIEAVMVAILYLRPSFLAKAI